ncbi:MAG: hypothetical protein QOF21_2289, partial [Actinomycetota bacterium]
DHRVRLVYEETGYVWYLRTLIQEQMKESGAVEPCLDFAFLDGAGTWHVDALAFLLLDRLLRPGAWLVFDDIDWTWAHVGDDQLAEVEQLYGDLGPVWQRDIKQLSDVWELLLVPSGRYDETRRDGQRAFARRI